MGPVSQIPDGLGIPGTTPPRAPGAQASPPVAKPPTKSFAVAAGVLGVCTIVVVALVLAFAHPHGPAARNSPFLSKGERAVANVLDPKLLDASASVGQLRISRCGQQGGHPVADGTVTNNTGHEESYRVSIGFDNKGNVPYGEGITVVRSVAPGKTAHWSILQDTSNFDPAKCEVLSQTN